MIGGGKEDARVVAFKDEKNVASPEELVSNLLHKSSPGSQINCEFLMSLSKL